MFAVPALFPPLAFYGIMGGPLLALVVILWWLFFSRAPWVERLMGVGLLVVSLFITARLVHESVAGAGMGMMFYMFGLPVLASALVVWAVLSRHLEAGTRRVTLVAAMAIACGLMTTLRLDGISGTGGIDWEWRWTPTAEEALLARIAEEPEPVPPAPAPSLIEPPATEAEETTADTASQAPDATVAVARDESEASPANAAQPARTEAEWPGFRGPHRDSVVRGSRIETDWTKSPPVELWRRAVGPGWSSFAVDGDRFYTQEQLGDDEIVSCYDVRTGQPIWRHRDATRFWEANAGAGPRATPTLADGRVYAFGATGHLSALDAADGSLLWRRDVAADTEKEAPAWGFSSSPLVTGGVVIVAAEGKLAGYDASTGEKRWIGGADGTGYSSPHLATLDGVEQAIILNGTGAVSVEPQTGAEIWKHEWPGDGIVQPNFTAEGDVLLGTGSGMGGATGLRRITVGHEGGEWNAERGAGAWTVAERWTSNGLKPYFNDFVVHEGHAYGFDGGILACVDLADGKRKWKGGRFGDGQLVLLADQDLLLVLSEKGELALVDARPEQFSERGRVKTIEGKTWNHPVFAGGVALVRNSEEMAAFRLAGASG
jgi:outer membrane protein assembly factor BamB